MSSSRSTVFVLILIGVVSALAGLLGNVAAGALPDGWQPYLWLAWPLFLLFTAAGIGLAIWQARRDPPAPPAQSPSHPVTQSPTPPAPRPTHLPISQPTSDPSYAYDVFISYSSADKEWVRGELLQTLERAGLRVCIDYRDFQPGAPSVTEMERAILTSRRTLLVLTPAYLRSAWTEFETLLLQTLDAANRERRLIPLLRERCDLPLRIRYLTYVNFVDPDDPAWAWTQLLTAVGAPPAQEAEQPPTPATWFLAHPYAMPPNFTGRRAERGELSDWLANDGEHPLLVICALGGFGKSALAWHWLLHDVDAARWPRVVWWSFYEPQATFESFLAETLAYLGVDGRRYPGPRQQADALLTLLRQPGTLLILDGFERALRAYSSLMAAYQGDEVAGGEVAGSKGQAGGAGTPSAIDNSQLTIDHSQLDCVSQVAEHFLRSLASRLDLRGKVLMTTRLTPRVLHAPGGDLLLGCREMALTQMQPADAVAFFRSQGIRGGRAEIEAACAPYGYHPLSLRLLAGLVKTDLQQPGDIGAAKRLDVSGDLVQRQHHVLETAYDSLPSGQGQLLSRIACFRGPVGYEALVALLPSPSGRGAGGEGDAALHDLVDRGMLHRDLKTNRFDLHPIVRRYAYDRLAGDARGETHARLCDYFAAVPPRDKVQTLDDLAPVIELYHHTLVVKQYDVALRLFRDRLGTLLYVQFGAYQIFGELLRGLVLDSGNTPYRLHSERDHAWALNALAAYYYVMGNPTQAESLVSAALEILSRLPGDQQNYAIGLRNLANIQLCTGKLNTGEASLQELIDLSKSINFLVGEAVGRQEMARLRTYQGNWDGAAKELQTTSALLMWRGDSAISCANEIYLAHWAMSVIRSIDSRAGMVSPLDPMGETLPMTGEFRSKDVLLNKLMEASHNAINLADTPETTLHMSKPALGTRAHWLLGAAHRANGDHAAADRHLLEALTRCRGINLVEFEADNLLDLARLRREQAQTRGSFGPEPQDDRMAEALRLAEEALLITERSGYVLQGADVRLFLAQLSLDAGDRAAALAHARLARQLAACDGPPDYTYKVAYEEAGAMVERLDHEGAK